jgi:molybdopterin/thiamine biosynthesis adenylyltransferase
VPVHSHDVSTLHQAELDRFTTDLIVAGFRVASSDRHNWIGPTDPALAMLGAASEMGIEIRDGWPHRHPYLFVKGLDRRRHVSASGNLCLWGEDDDGYGWLRLADVRARIAAWCADQEEKANEPILDPHLYYAPLDQTKLVVLDLEQLIQEQSITATDGDHGHLRAVLSHGLYAIGTTGPMKVAWFRRSRLEAPPADWEAVRAALTPEQRGDLDAFARWVKPRRACLVLVIWKEPPVTAVTAIRLQREGPGACETHSLEVALSGPSVMALRAGPDREVLAGKSVTLFGAGAIGSHLALLLAKSGTKALRVVDNKLLRPGDLTRHAASPAYVGLLKVDAVRQTIVDLLPTAHVEAVTSLAWEIDAIRTQLAGADLAIDATGNRAYADLVSRVAFAFDGQCPILSVALYRGGAIARVSVQATTRHPLSLREESNGFPPIPADESANTLEERWEAGCGGAVNQAPPAAVVAAAALGARAAISLLTGRLEADVDLVDVYEPLERSPFDTRGLRVFPLSNTAT